MAEGTASIGSSPQISIRQVPDAAPKDLDAAVREVAQETLKKPASTGSSFDFFAEAPKESLEKMIEQAPFAFTSGKMTTQVVCDAIANLVHQQVGVEPSASRDIAERNDNSWKLTLVEPNEYGDIVTMTWTASSSNEKREMTWYVRCVEEFLILVPDEEHANSSKVVCIQFPGNQLVDEKGANTSAYVDLFISSIPEKLCLKAEYKPSTAWMLEMVPRQRELREAQELRKVAEKALAFCGGSFEGSQAVADEAPVVAAPLSQERELLETLGISFDLQIEDTRSYGQCIGGMVDKLLGGWGVRPSWLREFTRGEITVAAEPDGLCEIRIATPGAPGGNLKVLYARCSAQYLILMPEYWNGQSLDDVIVVRVRGLTEEAVARDVRQKELLELAANENASLQERWERFRANEGVLLEAAAKENALVQERVKQFLQSDSSPISRRRLPDELREELLDVQLLKQARDCVRKGQPLSDQQQQFSKRAEELVAAERLEAELKSELKNATLLEEAKTYCRKEIKLSPEQGTKLGSFLERARLLVEAEEEQAAAGRGPNTVAYVELCNQLGFGPTVGKNSFSPRCSSHYQALHSFDTNERQLLTPLGVNFDLLIEATSELTKEQNIASQRKKFVEEVLEKLLCGDGVRPQWVRAAAIDRDPISVTAAEDGLCAVTISRSGGFGEKKVFYARWSPDYLILMPQDWKAENLKGVIFIRYGDFPLNPDEAQRLHAALGPNTVAYVELCNQLGFPSRDHERVDVRCSSFDQAIGSEDTQAELFERELQKSLRDIPTKHSLLAPVPASGLKRFFMSEYEKGREEKLIKIHQIHQKGWVAYQGGCIDPDYIFPILHKVECPYDDPKENSVEFTLATTSDNGRLVLGMRLKGAPAATTLWCYVNGSATKGKAGHVILVPSTWSGKDPDDVICFDIPPEGVLPRGVAHTNHVLATELVKKLSRK